MMPITAMRLFYQALVRHGGHDDRAGDYGAHDIGSQMNSAGNHIAYDDRSMDR